jgi:hypothetical protein
MDYRGKPVKGAVRQVISQFEISARLTSALAKSTFASWARSIAR